MQSTTIRQMKVAIADQAFSGSPLVWCPMGRVVAGRQEEGATPGDDTGVGDTLVRRFDYLRSDVRNLSRYMAELEDLAEAYRAFASNAKLSTSDDLAIKTKLLKRTQKVIRPAPDKQRESLGTDEQEAERAASGNGTRMGTLIPP
ncbi:MAG: hypothetical protein M3Y81_28005 [Chloroflexota bacterium]|nr:hypothetical protein [Chloroflexota bacterium]